MGMYQEHQKRQKILQTNRIPIGLEFVNGGYVLSAKDNNGCKSLHIQSSKGVTADA